MPNVNPWDYAEKSKSEHGAQVALFMWANMANRFGLTAANVKDAYIKPGVAQELLTSRGDLVSKLKWLHAIHNQGHGDKVRGAMAKAEGVKKGVFDLFLPVPMQGVNYNHGLYIEMKVDGGKVSVEQSEFSFDMLSIGYQCKIAWGWLEAAKIILDYLGYPDNMTPTKQG